MLKRTVSLRQFFSVPTTYVLAEKYENNFQLSTLIWEPEYALIGKLIHVGGSVQMKAKHFIFLSSVFPGRVYSYEWDGYKETRNISIWASV